MSLGAQEFYEERQILEADGCQLVQLLYRKALESAAMARGALAGGQIAVRTRAIGHVSAILNELTTSVDREAGGDVAQNLVELYDYLQTRLIAASTEQSDDPLEEVERLLGTLLEAWEQCEAPALAEVPATEHSPVDCLA